MGEEKGLDAVYITAFDLDDAWFQCLSKILDHGYVYEITKGSFAGQKRLEFDFVSIHVTNPGKGSLIPIIPEGMSISPPTDMKYVQEIYLQYLFTDQKTATEDYTYGERIHNPKARLEEKLDIEQVSKEVDLGKKTDEEIKNIYPYTLNIKREDGTIILSREIPFNINPFEQVIKDYKEKGYGSNQETIEIAMPSDINLNDPPCLRLIDTRIRYGKLHFIVYFRSWDLWGGFPSNLAGLQRLKGFMAEQIGVEDGEMIASSKGLHLYDYSWELAALRTNKQNRLKQIIEQTKNKS